MELGQRTIHAVEGLSHTFRLVSPSTASSMMVMVCRATTFWTRGPTAFSRDSTLSMPSRCVAAMYTLALQTVVHMGHALVRRLILVFSLPCTAFVSDGGRRLCSTSSIAGVVEMHHPSTISHRAFTVKQGAPLSEIGRCLASTMPQAVSHSSSATRGIRYSNSCKFGNWA